MWGYCRELRAVSTILRNNICQEIAWDAAVSQVLVVLPAGSTPLLWSAPSLMVQDELGNISTVEGALTLVQMMMAATLYPQRWFLLQP